MNTYTYETRTQNHEANMKQVQCLTETTLHQSLLRGQKRDVTKADARMEQTGSKRWAKLIMKVVSAWKTREHNARKCAEKLIMARNGVPVLDREIALATTEFPFACESWLTYFFDPSNVVTSVCGQVAATRAVTTNGQLFWLCRHKSQGKVYHSLESDPFLAMEEAMHTWLKRKQIRQEWSRVESFADSLLKGQQTCEVTRQDLNASVLCQLGAEGFLETFGLASKFSVSGWTAALLMKIEPQVGFVLHHVLERQDSVDD